MASVGAKDVSDGREEPATVRLLSSEMPEAFIREVVARQLYRMEIEPLPEHPLFLDATVRLLPGLSVWWSKGSPVRIRRTRDLLSDGNDNLVFQWTAGARFAEHLGREVALGPGDAILFSCAETRNIVLPSGFDTVSLSIPRNALGSLLRDPDSCLARAVPSGSNTLKLLMGYLELLRDESATPTLEVRNLAVAHVYDLLAVVLGATRDAAETARRHGMRAARLRAIKNSIRENLEDGELSLSDLAAAQRITPRYVQMLFEGEGTTFTEFARNERLTRAYRILTSPRCGDRKIAEIALACGFDDISNFNRQFRLRYNAAPSDVRRHAACPRRESGSDTPH